MLMSRRDPLSWPAAVRLALWPRQSWGRSLQYATLRLRRLRVLPRRIALGTAAGIFVAILPIPGVQLLAAAGLAWLIRGHRGVAALATFAANPVTYPLIWIASYGTGAMILGTPVSNAAQDLDTLAGLMAQTWSPTPFSSGALVTAWHVLRTLTIGALPLATLAAILAYWGVRRLLRGKPVAQVTRGATLVDLKMANRRLRQSQSCIPRSMRVSTQTAFKRVA